ncbi:hypothetical protein LF845_02170 [Deferribacterales bacterium Es71-Z0220]|uniref:hypothetical protein n=1 Tax=Deferrivibrio essentukiensis TaxID=2880922 RepID=UPI001F61F664|nr:hypothetical protein [Deferrivibrio essentukiensis]MCB4203765.1 hypothetical protein [Deferrivibrio essentukiensis]
MSINSIKRECFWDYDLSEDDILRIVSKGSFSEKIFLFQKILANSKHLLRDLQIFNKDDLKTLLKNYNVPNFNRDFLYKRKNIVEFFFFDKELEIEELKWTS